MKKDFDKFCNTFTVEELEHIVFESYQYDFSLEEYYYYCFDDDFFTSFFNDDPLEAARATHFGHVNWNDDRIRFNAYGNLVTISDYDFEEELDENRKEIVEEALDLYKEHGDIFNDDINERLADYLSE